MTHPAASPPPDRSSEPGKTTVQRALGILWLQQLLRTGGPFLLVVKLFAITALLGVFGFLEKWAHALLWLGFIVAALATLIHSWWRQRRISEGEARRAVERASGLPHRPLTALADTPALAPALWSEYRRRTENSLRRYQLRLPALALIPTDGRIWRLGSWVLLGLALVLAGSEAPQRLREAARPPVTALLPSATLDAFITPPDYTGQPPFALQPELAGVTAPEGSQLQVRVSGGWFPPVARIGDDRQRLIPEGGQKNSFVLTRPLTSSGPLSVRQDGRWLGRWHVSLMVDTPPSVTFARPPAPTGQQALRLDFTAIDDLGLAKIEAVVNPGTHAAAGPEPEPLVLPLPLRQPPQPEAGGFRYFDLTAHPWAGEDVLITLRATDTKGQTGESDPVSFTLPARTFANSIARAVIKLRRELVVRGVNARSDLIPALSRLAGEAEDNYAGDWVGPLALRVLAARLRYLAGGNGLPDTLQLMWDTALHFEDGGRNQSLADLRRLQQELEDALTSGTPDSEIQQLMQELGQAMQEHLDQLQQDQANGDDSASPAGQSISRQHLQDHLDRMRQLAQSGQRDEARQMLQQLQQMMENLQGSGDPQAREALRELDGITRDQQSLMDRGQQRQSVPGQQQPGPPTPAEQGSLADRLDSLMKKFGGQDTRDSPVPELERGRQSMREAERLLNGQGGDSSALQRQSEALDHLREARRALKEQAAAQAGPGADSDPFGRPRNSPSGATDNNRIDIPDPQETDRAREVLKELQRRAGDSQRPAEERDYLNRLLRWF